MVSKADEQRIIEIVIKAVGEADLKRLAKEMAELRKESKATRTEVERTGQEMKKASESIGGFGAQFAKAGKMLAGGFALTKLVKSSELITELTSGVQDLAGEFIDATLSAVGFTDALDEEFWLTAKQGARDLGHALGDALSTVAKWMKDSGVQKFWERYTVPGMAGAAARQAFANYQENAQIDADLVMGEAADFTNSAAFEQWQRTAEEEREKLVHGIVEANAKAWREGEENLRAFTERSLQHAAEQRDLERYGAGLRATSAQEAAEQAQIMASDAADKFQKSFKPLEFSLDAIAQDFVTITESSEGWETIEENTWSWNEALRNALGYMKALQALQADLTTQVVAWGEALTYSFKGVLTGELHNTRDLLRSITTEMRNFYAELAARKAAEQTLEWLGVLFKGIGAGAGGGGATGNWSGPRDAMGNAYAQGHVIPMATGAIVSRPTFFPMANGLGLMGEAGPEAVLPLRRGSDGKLGVSSSRAAVIIENHAAPVTASIEGDDAEMRIILRAASLGANMAQERMNRSVRTGYGATAQSMQSAYGLRRRV